VNEGTCFSQVREATLDPIVFLEATTKLVEKNETDPQSLYLSAKDITLGGISCGFMETQSLSSLTINKKAG
jgi:hypothetical protein